MADMLLVSEDTFKNEVLDSEQPVLVDFSAVWCQPCKMLDPVVKQLAGEWDGKVKVVKIDADENPNLVMQFGVMGIPTLLFFKGGEIKDRVTGFMPKEKLVARFTPHFNLLVLKQEGRQKIWRSLHLTVSHQAIESRKIHTGCQVQAERGDRYPALPAHDIHIRVFRFIFQPASFTIPDQARLAP